MIVDRRDAGVRRVAGRRKLAVLDDRQLAGAGEVAVDLVQRGALAILDLDEVLARDDEQPIAPQPRDRPVEAHAGELLRASEARVRRRGPAYLRAQPADVAEELVVGAV